MWDGLCLRAEPCVWLGDGDTLYLQPSIYGDFNGIQGRINVVDSDKGSYSLFKEINRSFGRGITSRVSDEMTIIFTVGAKQRLRIFGKRNCELQGGMVTKHGDINIVNVQKDIFIPMLEELQPLGPDS